MLLPRNRAREYNLALLDRRLRELSPELLLIWSDEAMSRPRKRELLFERWDECEERFSVQPGDIPAEAVSEIDRIRVETAERRVARARSNSPWTCVRSTRRRMLTRKIARL